MQAEYGFGLRTTLDVLIVDDNLRAAQFSLAQSRHDVTLAEAAFLQADGRLQITYLVSDQPAYEPRKHFNAVRNTAAPPWEPLVRALDASGAAQ